LKQLGPLGWKVVSTMVWLFAWALKQSIVTPFFAASVPFATAGNTFTAQKRVEPAPLETVAEQVIPAPITAPPATWVQPEPQVIGPNW
jgi:hypothetical protein